MQNYVPESFTPSEQQLLSRYFTNLDLPVFALVNLPEVVKGALFARYSRSAKSLRRLFLDEFVEELERDLDIGLDPGLDARIGLGRAERLYAKVFGDYGDDSVAQLAGVHVACEQSSNLLTKVLEWGRLMSYLEQSTRYVSYDSRLASGHYRYERDPRVLDSTLGARYIGEMDRMFDTYAGLVPKLEAALGRRYSRDQEVSELAHRRALRARSLDGLRGLLPAGALSNLGIYGSGQSYELLLLRLLAHPLPEAVRCGELLLCELRKVIPSFLTRVDRPERGGAWASYLASCRKETAEVTTRLFGGGETDRLSSQPSVTLVDFDPDGEDKVLAAMCYPYTSLSETEVRARVAELSPAERSEIVTAYVGRRTNRRHRPGRAFEATSYRFDIVTDYGAFRDLQRHRMATIEWQPLSTSLGFLLPAEVEEAGLGSAYEASIERSRMLYEALLPRYPEQAGYAVALAFNLRFSIQLSAREALHLIELRSSPQGHPSYRQVAQAMHDAIARDAGHHIIAEAMSFVDHSEAGLGRLNSEQARLRRLGSLDRSPPPATEEA
jgi:thymidylate synthase ThyX